MTVAIDEIPKLRQRFWGDLKIAGSERSLNQTLEHAGRVADFLEFSEVMCRDALVREESCGSHFREEHQTEEGEALRDDVRFAHVAVWEHRGDEAEPRRHEEQLSFHALPLARRDYKT